MIIGSLPFVLIFTIYSSTKKSFIKDDQIKLFFIILFYSFSYAIGLHINHSQDINFF